MRLARCSCREENLRGLDRYPIVSGEVAARCFEERPPFDGRNRDRFRAGGPLRKHSKVTTCDL